MAGGRASPQDAFMTADGERHRLFLGLPCPATPQIRDLLTDLRQAPEARAGRLRPVPEQNLHLTLRYLGLVEVHTIPALCRLLEPLIGSCTTFDCTLHGLGRFSRSLWLGAEVPSPVYELVREMEVALAGEGFPADSRPFRPHVTLARMAPGTEFPPAEFEARREHPVMDRVTMKQAHLYRSERGKEGSRYTPVHTFMLKERQGGILGAGLEP